MGPWHKPGGIARFSVPLEHVQGHEQADNERGPRPWLIVFNRFATQSELVIGVPLATNPPPYGSRAYRALNPGDIDTTGFTSPISGHGFVYLDQLRVLSLKRCGDLALCGRMKQDPFNAIREELASMMSSMPRY
jgi:hypothetical protein